MADEPVTWADIPQPAVLLLSRSDALKPGVERIVREHPGEVEVLYSNPNIQGLEHEPEADKVPTPCPDVAWMRRQGNRFSRLLAHVFTGRVYPRSRTGTVNSSPSQGFLGTAIHRIDLIARLRDKLLALFQRSQERRVYLVDVFTGCGGGGSGSVLPMNGAIQGAATEIQGAVDLYLLGVMTRSTTIDDDWQARRLRETACLLSYSAIEESAQGVSVGDETLLMPPLYNEFYVIDGEPATSVERQRQYVEEFVLALLRPGIRDAIDQRQAQWDNPNDARLAGELLAVANPGGVAVGVWSPENFAEFAERLMAPALFTYMASAKRRAT